MTTTRPADAGTVDRSRAADFVARFEAAWARSQPEPLLELLAEDVVLRQPSMPDIHGKPAARESFERLFRAFPGLTLEVDHWGGDGDVLFIGFTMSCRFGGRPLSWPAVDRFILRDGLAVERVNYFDSARLFREILRRPRGWRGLAASGMRPRP